MSPGVATQQRHSDPMRSRHALLHLNCLHMFCSHIYIYIYMYVNVQIQVYMHYVIGRATMI